MDSTPSIVTLRFFHHTQLFLLSLKSLFCFSVCLCCLHLFIIFFLGLIQIPLGEFFFSAFNFSFYSFSFPLRYPVFSLGNQVFSLLIFVFYFSSLLFFPFLDIRPLVSKSIFSVVLYPLLLLRVT